MHKSMYEIPSEKMAQPSAYKTFRVNSNLAVVGTFPNPKASYLAKNSLLTLRILLPAINSLRQTHSVSQHKYESQNHKIIGYEDEVRVPPLFPRVPIAMLRGIP